MASDLGQLVQHLDAASKRRSETANSTTRWPPARPRTSSMKPFSNANDTYSASLMSKTRTMEETTESERPPQQQA
ncbi:hypothetical protein PG990_007092 [Apiospora arundinis]